ncbi:MAG TPA: Maf family protein [Candidatus Nitrosocosmicus sp.]|nr:Maf family protein [Candidatus Nitrosocosmicus sp.]
MNIHPLVLASGSKSRRKLLESLDIPFEVVASNINEKEIRNNKLKQRAEELARTKAEVVSSKYNAIVIAADTFCVHKSTVLEKPRNLEEAFQMVKLLSGKSHICYTGFCYIDPFNNINYSTTIIVEFNCREFDDQEIETYINNFSVKSWSASVSPAHEYGLTMFSKVNGSLTAFTHGLPMEELVPLLRKSGFEIKPNIKLV